MSDITMEIGTPETDDISFDIATPGGPFATLGANTFTDTQTVEASPAIAFPGGVGGAPHQTVRGVDGDGDPLIAEWSYTVPLPPQFGGLSTRSGIAVWNRVADSPDLANVSLLYPRPIVNGDGDEWVAGQVSSLTVGNIGLSTTLIPVAAADAEKATQLATLGQVEAADEAIVEAIGRAAGGPMLGDHWLIVGGAGSGAYRAPAPTLASKLVIVIDAVPLQAGSLADVFGELLTWPHPSIDYDAVEAANRWSKGRPWEYLEFARDGDPVEVMGEFDEGRIFGDDPRPPNATHWNEASLLTPGQRRRWMAAIVGDDGAGGWWSAVLREAYPDETPDETHDGVGWMYHKRRAGSGTWSIANTADEVASGLNQGPSSGVHSIEAFDDFDGDLVAAVRAEDHQADGTLLDPAANEWEPEGSPYYVDLRWEALEEEGTSGLVPESRTLAGLDLTVNRSASDLRTALALVPGTDVQAQDSDLAAIAALTTTSYGRALLTLADQAALHATLGTGTLSSSTFLRGDGTWSTPTAVVERPQIYRTGIYHPLQGTHAARHSASTTATTANEGLWQFILPLENVGVTGATWYCATGQTGALARLWLYRVTDGLPAGNPILDSGTISAAATAYLSPTWTRVDLVGGRLYAVRLACDTANVAWRQWSGDQGETPQTISLGSTGTSGRIVSFADTTGIGAAPASPPAISPSAKYPPYIYWMMAR